MNKTKIDFLEKRNHALINSNTVIKKIISNRMLYAEENPDNSYSDALIRDFTPDSLVIAGHKNSARKNPFQQVIVNVEDDFNSRSGERKLSEKEIEDNNTILTKLQKWLKINEKTAKNIVNNHSQQLISFNQKIIQASFVKSPGTYVLGNDSAKLYKNENGRICLKIKYKDIYFKTPPTGQETDDDQKILRGTLTSEFFLTKDGFKLRSLTSNSKYLLAMCNKQNTQALKKEDYDLAEQEQNLRNIAKNYDHQDLKSSASTILNEGYRLLAQNKIDKQDLIEIFEQTATTLNSGPNENYANLIERVCDKKRPWLKIIGGAMLAILAAGLIAASVTTAVASFGVSTPLSLVGIAVGTGALVKAISGVCFAIGMTAAVTGTATSCGFFSRQVVNDKKPLYTALNNINKDITSTYKAKIFDAI